jgi:hypothetical protein
MEKSKWEEEIINEINTGLSNTTNKLTKIALAGNILIIVEDLLKEVIDVAMSAGYADGNYAMEGDFSKEEILERYGISNTQKKKEPLYKYKDGSCMHIKQSVDFEKSICDDCGKVI